MKIIIIGGGPAALTTAITAKTNQNEVIILEKNNKCGKKLLLTGNGRCNYFNEDFHIKHYHSYHIDELKPIINNKNKNLILDFFDYLGIIPKVINGYYYPFSNQAITILEALLEEAKRKGVIIQTDTIVNEISYDKCFNLETTKGLYQADIVVLATGSNAMPKTGSDGNGYQLAKYFNHQIIKPLPALVQLRGNGSYLHDWEGIRTDVKLTLLEDYKVIKENAGEIQLTSYGISGICVLSLSSMAIRGLANNHQEEILIDFLPWLNDDFHQYLDERQKKLKARNISRLLDGMLNYKLVNAILKKNKINYETPYDALDSVTKDKVIHDLKSFSFKITGYNDFDAAQVCSGGIPLTEVNMNTMESLKQKNLYIVGELLDVDGECGGYNLGFAWLSGLLAGLSIKEKK